MNRVSFDFDWTLSFPDGTSYEPMVKLLKWLLKKGRTVYIVSSRDNDYNNKTHIQQFLDSHGITGLEDIILTNGNLKYSTLLHIKVTDHFDDDPIELEEATAHGIITHNVWSDVHEDKCRYIYERYKPTDSSNT